MEENKKLFYSCNARDRINHSFIIYLVTVFILSHKNCLNTALKRNEMYLLFGARILFYFHLLFFYYFFSSSTAASFLFV